MLDFDIETDFIMATVGSVSKAMVKIILVCSCLSA